MYMRIGNIHVQPVHHAHDYCCHTIASGLHRNGMNLVKVLCLDRETSQQQVKVVLSLDKETEHSNR